MDEVKIPKRAIFAVLGLFLVFISPLWFSAPYKHTDKAILQKPAQTAEASEFMFSPFIVDGVKQSEIKVHYGVTSQKKTRDWLFKVETEDVFNNEWYLMVTDGTLTLRAMKVNSLSLLIDGKKYGVNIDDNKSYQVLIHPLNFKKPPVADVDYHYNEVSMILFPLPEIPKETFDLIMTGTVTDNQGIEKSFTYFGSGVVKEREYHYSRLNVLLPY